MAGGGDAHALLHQHCNQEEDEAYKLSFWQAILSDYRTPRQVVIRSPYLKVPQLIFYGIVSIYIFGWQIIWHKSFLDRAPVAAKLLAQVEQPSANFFTCSNVDTDCDDDWRPMSAFSYCDKDNWPEGFGPCKYYGVHEVQPIKYEQAVFVATSFSHISQTRCKEVGERYSNGTLKCKNLWNNNDIAEHFVAGSEDFQVIFQHSVVPHKPSTYRHKIHKTWSGSDMMGSVTLKDGSERRIPCRGSHCKDKKIHAKKMDPCGSETPGVDACFANQRGDVISIAKILEMANVSLDESRYGGKNMPRRRSGVSLMLDVTYDNEKYFWNHWPFGHNLAYTYKARELDFGEQSRFRVTKWHHLTTNENERTLYKATGILILVTPHGEIGFFSFLKLILSLAAASTLFGLADIFIRKVVLQVYKFVKGCKKYHVYLMFNYFSRDMTATSDQVRSVIEKLDKDGSHYIIDADVQEQIEAKSKTAKRVYWQDHDFRNLQERAEGICVLVIFFIFVVFVIGLMYAGAQM